MATGSSRSRVHVGPHGFPHDRSGAADVIRMTVSEEQVLELVWRTVTSPDRPEDRCFRTRVHGLAAEPRKR